jgi:hypothetical protein
MTGAIKTEELPLKPKLAVNLESKALSIVLLATKFKKTTAS